MARPIQDIAIGGYIPGNSILHRLDPRVKLLGLLLVLTGVFLTRAPLGAFVNLAACIALAVVCQAGWRIWLWGLRRFIWMLAIVAGINLALNSAGSNVIIFGWESPITVDGLQTSVLFTLALVQAILLSMVLTFTTKPDQLTRGCERLGSPLKRLGVPVAEITLVLLLAMRFVPQIQLEARAIVDAQKARGVEFGSGTITARASNFVAVLSPAMTASLRRADGLALAMSARGFQPGTQRSELSPLQMSRGDWVAALLMLLLFSCQIALFR